MAYKHPRLSNLLFVCKNLDTKKAQVSVLLPILGS